jgi:hypothetical protein
LACNRVNHLAAGVHKSSLHSRHSWARSICLCDLFSPSAPLYFTCHLTKRIMVEIPLVLPFCTFKQICRFIYNVLNAWDDVHYFLEGSSSMHLVNPTGFLIARHVRVCCFVVIDHMLIGATLSCAPFTFFFKVQCIVSLTPPPLILSFVSSRLSYS